MELGIMLPLAKPFAASEPERIGQALSLGYSDLWLQERPLGGGPPGHRDHGTGHDPLLFAAHLARKYGPRGARVGLAILRLDYRHPYVAARAVASAQSLGDGQPLLLGLGRETGNLEKKIRRAAQTYLTIRSLLLADQTRDAFLLPPGFTPPAMYLASGKLDLWQAINYQAEGWLTTHFDPREIQAIGAPLRERVPGLEVVVQVFFRLDTSDENALRPVQRSALLIGKNPLRGLVNLWREVGVRRVIYFPPETPSEEQLRLFASVVLEGER